VLCSTFSAHPGKTTWISFRPKIDQSGFDVECSP
jgi:hypothetical protein